jgi:hypothetical protein
MKNIASGGFCLVVVLVFWFVGFWPLPAGAQGATPMLEKPQPTSERPEPGEKKEEAPTTCGPLISDGCIPIEEHHASIQVLGALSFYTANFSPNWRRVSTRGDFHTFNLPVKFTYGPTKNLELYVVAPFIVNWANNVDRGAAGPNGERSAGYAGIGDMTAVAKYLLLEETASRPAVTAVGGVGFPTGHAHHLNPAFLAQDAVGAGSFNFITGINLYKWLKPFLVYSNIWLNSPINMFPLRGTDFPQSVRNRENVTFNLAAEYPITKKWILLLEMYSTWTWSNPGTESLGFQSTTTVLGFLPGIEYFITEKWAVSAGAAFDAVGKFGGHKITPALTVYYNF